MNLIIFTKLRKNIGRYTYDIFQNLGAILDNLFSNQASITATVFIPFPMAAWISPCPDYADHCLSWLPV